jgi:N-acetylglucosaminyldiphosphoundecaprenol N-acetyl-beta-D-mannosaminyltransferase
MVYRPKQLVFLGVPVDDISMDETVASIDAYISQGRFHQIATANLNFITNSIKDGRLRLILQQCSLVLPDGTPLLWAARLMGAPLRERVAGYNLVPRLVQHASEKGYRIFLLGTTEDCSAGAATWMREHFPQVHIVGQYSPPMTSLTNMDHSEILARIRQAKPDILFVAFGNPKQEEWLAMHREQLRVPVSIGVGGSLNYLAGQASHAPHWMRKAGLESVYRVWREPRRLAKRYLADLYVACFHLVPQIVAVRLQPSDSEHQLTYRQHGDTLIVIPSGCLGEESVRDIERLIAQTKHRMLSLTFDLSALTSINPNALSFFVAVGDVMRTTGKELSLTGVSVPLRRVLTASHIDRHIRIKS